MKSVNAKRYDIIRQARARVATGDYSSISRLKSIKCEGKVVFIRDKLLTPEDLFRCYEYVERVNNAPTLVTDAVGRMVDGEVLATLDEEGREKYVLELASLYNELLDEYKAKAKC